VFLARQSYFRLGGPRPRFLFVDDGTIAFRSLRRMLSALRPHWLLVWEGDVGRGLELLLAEEFNVVVADVQLLQLDNPVFFRVAERYSPHTRRVAHSVVRSSPRHLHCARSAQHLLLQPLDAGEFLLVLERALAECGPSSGSSARAG
jgi:response regulator RpfG family c-di-GMP phosphodiesterase